MGHYVNFSHLLRVYGPFELAAEHTAPIEIPIETVTLTGTIRLGEKTVSTVLVRSNEMTGTALAVDGEVRMRVRPGAHVLFGGGDPAGRWVAVCGESA